MKKTLKNLCGLALGLMLTATGFAQSTFTETYKSAVNSGVADFIGMKTNLDGSFQTVQIPAAIADSGAAVCYPDGTYKINGQIFKPANSKTCGIQEAFNALATGGPGLPGGGIIRLAPGTFLTSETIYMPSNQLFGTSLSLIGSGIASSIILMTNDIPHEVMNISPGQIGTSNAISFYMSGLVMGSVTNAATNILTLYGEAESDFSNRGTIGGGKINDCIFGWWKGITNDYGGAINTAGLPVNLGKVNLVGINFKSNFGGDFSIEHNSFYYCMTKLDADNADFIHNQIFGSGVYAQNDWPSSSHFYAGYAVNLVDTTTLHNAIHVQDIGYNHFVGNNTRGYLVGQNTLKGLIHDDFMEGAGGTFAVVAGPFLQPLEIQNCQSDSGFVLKDAVSTTDWSVPFVTDTNLIKVTYSPKTYYIALTNNFLVNSNWFANGTGATGSTNSPASVVLPGGTYTVTYNGYASPASGSDIMQSGIKLSNSSAGFFTQWFGAVNSNPTAQLGSSSSSDFSRGNGTQLANEVFSFSGTLKITAVTTAYIAASHTFFSTNSFSLMSGSYATFTKIAP